jgi:spore cortex formation protein SpoVR/YcgB (stage V sporulation)
MTKEELKEMFSRSDWNEETILEADKVISRIAEEYLGLNTYPNQFEIVSSEQMLDAYSLVGLPISYNHWKFGKDFVINKSKYKRGQMGLAYELVINSNPCISYNMEDNTTCLMLLVLAHAAYGHNHFFKNNYLFKQWTHADAIVDYMLFAREYVEKCEEKYGYEEVERILDACHMIERYGVDKYTKPQRISTEKEKERLKKVFEDERILVDDMWRTIPKDSKEEKQRIDRFPKQPEENILYFIEKNSPNLKVWQRELIRIVRKTAQYFYPQGQTKVINEGCATFSHYEIINKMYDEGYLDEGFMMEFFHNHSNVIFQPGFDSKFYSGLNPYTLGFNIFQDLKRMSLDPTEEDKEWFPEIAGKGNWAETFRYIVENFKDETFVLQYLSPKVIRDMRLFEVTDEEQKRFYRITSIHNKQGYKQVRKSLSETYNRETYIPDIQVYDVDVNGDRTLTLNYTSTNNKKLNMSDVDVVIDNISLLWGFPVRLIENGDNGVSISVSDELF